MVYRGLERKLPFPTGGTPVPPSTQFSSNCLCGYRNLRIGTLANGSLGFRGRVPSGRPCIQSDVIAHACKKAQGSSTFRFVIGNSNSEGDIVPTPVKKIALVTGANKGIGRAIAAQL